MKLGKWSTNASNNNSTPPDGWPEGQLPSTVNDCGREMMASIRTFVGELPFMDLDNTPSYLTATTFSLGAADSAHFQVGLRLKLFDATTLYGTIDSVSATFVSVVLDSGALTASLSSIAVSVIAPQNTALPTVTTRANENSIINGGFDIWQLGTSFVPANDTVTYTADRFAWLQSSGAVVVVTRASRSANSANVPTVAQASAVYQASLRIDVGGADASIAANEYGFIRYIVEGFDWRWIAHQRNCMSFWAETNCSGIYSVAFFSSASSAFYAQNYTLDTVNTWTKFSITVPEAPTTPYTWDYENGVGLGVLFTFAAGSARRTNATSWTASTVFAGSQQVNFFGTVGNYFKITGIKLEVGSSATDPKPIVYADELRRCQRYVEKSYPVDVTPGTISASLESVAVPFVTGTFNCPGVPFKVSKRTKNPPTTIYRPSTGGTGAVEYLDGSSAFSYTTLNVGQNGIQSFAFASSAGNSALVKFHYVVRDDF